MRPMRTETSRSRPRAEGKDTAFRGLGKPADVITVARASVARVAAEARAWTATVLQMMLDMRVLDSRLDTRSRSGPCDSLCGSSARPSPLGAGFPPFSQKNLRESADSELLVTQIDARLGDTRRTMADWFVAQFLDEWEVQKGTSSNVPKYNKKCLESDFHEATTAKMKCRGPAYPGDTDCRVADRLMNQFHNEFLRIRSYVELGDARKLVTDQDRLAHFLLRSRELVAMEAGACKFHRLETVKNPFLSPGQCRECVRKDDLGMLKKRDMEVIESRRMQLMGALRGLRMKDGKSVEETVADIICGRLEKKTELTRE